MTEFEKAKAIKRRSNAFSLTFELCVLLICTVIFVLPFINIVAISFSSPAPVMSGKVFFWPIGFNVDAWARVFKNSDLINSFVFTVILTALCTVSQLLVLMFAAYPMSRKNLKGRRIIFIFFLIPMYFGGGLIPTYLLYQAIGLLNNPLVLVLPGLFSVYNMLILRTAFSGVPDSIEESAKLDGAGDFTILFRIYFYLTLPTLATLALWAAVGRWNSFMDAVFFLPNNQKFIPLQLVLQRTLGSVTQSREQLSKDNTSAAILVVKETQKSANLLFTVIPIILVYPWLQKFFVKGVLIGSVKS